MKLPNPKNSGFMYQMSMLFDIMDERLLRHIPKGLFKDRDITELESMIAYLIIHSDEIKAWRMKK